MVSRSFTQCLIAVLLIVSGICSRANAGPLRDRVRGEPMTKVGKAWVEIDGVIYGAKADARGPIGGGPGYKAIVTEGDYTVTTIQDLLDALAQAKAGETVFIPGDVEIDCTARVFADELVIEIPEGVTLASDRGHNGSPGAMIHSDAYKTIPLIRAAGPDVRVTGLRIFGPDPKTHGKHHHRAHDEGMGGSSYYYRLPNSRGIQTEHSGLTVDNCELNGWSHAGVYLEAGDNHYVHHNYIHHCQRAGLGYGVSHSTSVSLIEFNLFNYNRHSIAGSGYAGCSYEARNNIQLGSTQSHHFDMHGQELDDGRRIAGAWTKIHHNTFFPDPVPRGREDVNQLLRIRSAIHIRGVPTEGTEIHHNWFMRPSEPSPDALRYRGNARLRDNLYGAARRFRAGPTKVEQLSGVRIEPAARPGRVRLTLSNPTDQTVKDLFAARIWPVGAASVVGRDEAAFRVRPGKSVSWEFSVRPNVEADPGGFEVHLVRQRGGRVIPPGWRWYFDDQIKKGGIAADFPRDGERYVRVRVLGRRIDSIPVPVTLDAVRAALAGQETFVIRGGERELARVRFALAGKYLAVDADANDADVVQTKDLWDGSSLEVFGAMSADAPIGQALLGPAVGDKPAKALKARDQKISPAPAIRLRSTPREGGYSIQALIPLEVLAIQPGAGRMLLQFQTSHVTPGSDARQHATTFDAGASIVSPIDNLLFGDFETHTTD